MSYDAIGCHWILVELQFVLYNSLCNTTQFFPFTHISRHCPAPSHLNYLHARIIKSRRLLWIFKEKRKNMEWSVWYSIQIDKKFQIKSIIEFPCLQSNKMNSVMKIVNLQLNNMQTISQFDYSLLSIGSHDLCDLLMVI